jgi:divalent metal cation (Fe/Co/Zn/Cd) transporter
MLRRIGVNGGESRDEFEQRALRITGAAFYLLTAGLLITSIISIVQNHRPETTVWGIVISLVSIAFMWYLIRQKTRVGKALGSQAILADAACSRACVFLSVVLMLSSVGYYVTGIGSLDAIGALLISWLAFREGREAFEKAAGLNGTCNCSCSNGQAV